MSASRPLRRLALGAVLSAVLVATPASPALANQFNGAYGVKSDHAAGVFRAHHAAAKPKAAAATFGRHLVADGLAFPGAFTFAPDGRIFYAERFTGEIRIINRSKDTNRLFFDVQKVATDGERGLLGLALHPGFPDTPFVYAYVTRTINGKTRNQIVRIKSENGKGTDLQVIWSSSTLAATIHNGGHIAFGPGGFLFAVQGEAGDPSKSQDTSVPAGKVLRMTGTGKAAPGNPFDNRVFSFGLRNSYGFAFDPRTGRMWETENGPECNDELNRIVRGGNFAWGPHETCGGTAPHNTNQDGPKPRIQPKRFYTPTIAPTGAVFCARCHLGTASQGRLFFGAWNTGQIRRVTLNDERLDVVSQRVVFTHSSGILSMEAGPGGGIYFSDDDSIFKLVLK